MNENDKCENATCAKMSENDKCEKCNMSENEKVCAKMSENWNIHVCRGTTHFSWLALFSTKLMT